METGSAFPLKPGVAGRNSVGERPLLASCIDIRFDKPIVISPSSQCSTTGVTQNCVECVVQYVRSIYVNGHNALRLFIYLFVVLFICLFAH